MNAIRKALESRYKGVCNVYVWENYRDPITGITRQQEVLKLEKQPCRLSIERQTTTNATGGPATIAQITKLFIAPELDIPAGSKIVVTQNGKTTEYARSGEPAVYTNHQEVTLDLFEGYA